jgi:hypothetical protein
MGLRSFAPTVLLLAACGGRSVSWSDGGRDSAPPAADHGPITQGDLLARPDKALPIRDDAGGCGGPELQMGLVSTFFDGLPKTTLTETVNGEIDYHGPLTYPLASSPLFAHEIQIQNRIIQYYLPAGVTLPLTVKQGALYSVTMKRRFIPGSTFTEALVIKASVPGPWPFVLIMEPATYGQALDPDDPIISPLKVKLLESSDCPTSPSPSCAPLYIDRLRFEATTGAGLIAAELEQGEVIGLTMFGRKMRLANVASWHQRPACPSGTETAMSYLLVTE